MDVMVAFLARAVVDRSPPALRLPAGLGEAHRVHEVVGDVAPLLVGQGSFFSAQAQRSVPHVGVLVSVRNAFFLDGPQPTDCTQPPAHHRTRRSPPAVMHSLNVGAIANGGLSHGPRRSVQV